VVVTKKNDIYSFSRVVETNTNLTSLKMGNKYSFCRVVETNPGKEI
jgi:hypothetical protein